MAVVRQLVLLITGILALALAGDALAGSVDLQWNPVTNDARVRGYQVYYGLASGQYQWVAEADTNGAATSTKTVEDLPEGNTYFFTVRSRNNDASLVSAFSSEVSATVESTDTTDTTPPTVSVTTTPAGSTYTSAQTVNVNANASDNVSVTRVEFYDGATLMGTDTSSPYRYAWPVAGADNGSHRWTARAYDAAGNASTSSALTRTVNISSSDTTPPTVSLSTAPSGPTYSSAQTVSINANAADNGGVSRVEFYDGTTLMGTDTSSPYSYAWTVTSADNGSHRWTASAYDAAGNVATSVVRDRTVDIAAPSDPQDLQLEVGEIAVDHEWTRVDFKHEFSDPIVIANPLSANDSDPAVVRVRRVDSQGFSVRVQEWDYLDDWHTAETVSYLVMESGSYQLSNGAWMEADRYQVGNASVPAGFDAPFAVAPVVLTTVTTDNEWEAVTARVHGIKESGFQAMLQEQEANTQNHTAETVSYIAWEPSVGEIDGMPYEVARTADAVTDASQRWNFEQAFGAPPALLGGLQTTDGGDTANLRCQDRTSAGVSGWVEEEQSSDSETSHTTEVAGYFAIENTAGGTTPLPPVAQDVIVDNLDADSTYFTGTWRVSSGPEPWLGQSLYNSGGGDIFRWRPAQLADGATYDVYAWWTYHGSRGTKVPYRVHHAGGTDTVVVNQGDQALGGQWNYLGTYRFDAATAFIEVSSENGQACADAVRLILAD